MGVIKFDKKEVLALVNSLPADAEITLVGDQGIYLMSFAQTVMPRTIVYAEGCNPDKDEDFYENKRAVYGGDDGGDDIGSAGDLLKIASEAYSTIIVRVTPTEISIGYDVAGGKG